MSGALLSAALLLCLGVSAGALALLHVIGIEERFSRRFARATGAEPELLGTEPGATIGVRLLAAIGFALARTGLLTDRTQADLRDTLRTAGIRTPQSVMIFAGTKVLLLALGALLAGPVLRLLGFSPFWSLTATAIAAAAGLLAPDFVVRLRRSRYLRVLERGLADSLDMMVICAEAGLSLEATLVRVATEMQKANRAIADELATTAGEMRIGTDQREAFVNLGRRTGLEGVKRLGVTLLQTIQYGTPLTQALRTLAIELRHEQLNRFEARAARLPVLLTVPMVLFILPCVFIVVGGPAVLRVMSIFKH